MIPGRTPATAPGAAAGTAALQFSAETLGSRVPRTRAEGRVIGVYERACNVALTGGGLVTLLAQSCGNHPHGVRLSCSPRFDRMLRPGTPVRLSRDRLAFDDCGVVVLVSDAVTWSTALRPGIFDWRGGGVDRVLVVERDLRAQAAGKGSDLLHVALGIDHAVTPLAARAAEVLPRLAYALQHTDGVAALGAIARLIGVGPGLSPAGDDFVVGWLAGAALAARSPAQLNFLHTVCDSLAGLRDATTQVSWQHLDDARALAFSERLGDLAVAIAQPGAADVHARLDAQLAVGATSGADAAAGLLAALLAACPGPQWDRRIE